MSAPTLLLMDNGSLEPAAILNLRNIAQDLGCCLGKVVHPVSLLHSDRIPPDRLDGHPAGILETELKRMRSQGAERFRIIPLFFGPSRGLTDYLPRRFAVIRKEWPELVVELAPPLCGTPPGVDARLARILEERVREVLPGDGVSRVALVDHGSPVPAVTAVREALVPLLAQRLGATVRMVRGASMERRPGPEYAFADPLLEQLLEDPEWRRGSVILALLFLAPGRHAGPTGDVARIAAAATARFPGLRIHRTEPIGTHPLLVEILVDRARETLAEPV